MLKRRIHSVTVSLITVALLLSLIIIATPAEAATLHTAGVYSWTDSGGYTHTTAYIINGNTLVYCIAPDKPAPSSNGSSYNNGSRYTDASVTSLLYYGYGGSGYKGSGSKTDYVKTYVALNNWLSGHTSTRYPSNSDSFVASLLKHASNHDSPQYNISFDHRWRTSTVQNGVQQSDTMHINGNKGWATLNVPDGVTIYRSDGKHFTGGNVKVSAGMDFYFTAPLSYNQQYVQGNVNAWEDKIASILYQPSGNTDYQPVLERPSIYNDPTTLSGFTINFWNRQQTITINYIDKYTGLTMWQDISKQTIGTVYDKMAYPNDFTRTGHFYKYNNWSSPTGDNLKEQMPNHNVVLNRYFDPYQHVVVDYKNKYPNYDLFEHHDDLKKVGSRFDYAPKAFNVFGNIYDPENNTHFSGKVPFKDINGQLKDILRRTVTVNYIDIRTNAKIALTKTYTKHQGDTYSETHPTLKKSGTSYTYQYVKETGSAQSGTVGTGNITINYYYQVPLLKVRLKSMQIYTAPAVLGLPVKVQLEKVLNYSSDSPDMLKGKIGVSLYQGSKRLSMQQYTAAALPTAMTFKILTSSGLTVNTHKPYTVKFEGYSADDFDVESNARQLTTEGYTSSQDTVTLDLPNTFSHEAVTKRVVMTQVTPGTTPELFNESFDYSATPLPDKKTGYGVSTQVSYGYENDLGTDYQYAAPVAKDNFTFQAPESLQDSNLDYPVSSGLVKVPMTEKVNNEFYSSGQYFRGETYIFPHVNVEDQTGKLFTDQQVTNHDSRIKNQIYDGNNEFYTPIWPAKNEDIPMNYPVDYVTNPLGVNKLTIRMTDQIRIVAYMRAYMGSNTLKSDEILLEPVNTENPFPQGVPKGWSENDIKWIEEK